ncbi:hypothetical protein [Haloactinomyces albus]|uniref:Uncharacterized protein n=1 Tax=Haloactinomyces albus TaxID=1352928 RepID=A0AAE4CKZ4_9ACTN|nr:hypothetical protein [Haloactinomyces albus]MDR7301675.1 hypothetical protein [Haloactinomyces albus]
MTVDTGSLVRFGRNERDHITVHVPESHRPVLDVLRDLPIWAWPEILHHSYHPTDEEWDTGGNVYGITINRRGVTIENEVFDITLATIPHGDFITIVEGYLAELDRWYTEHGIPTEQRRDLYHPTENPTGKPYHQH